jgi:hypothetical protein
MVIRITVRDASEGEGDPPHQPVSPAPQDQQGQQQPQVGRVHIRYYGHGRQDDLHIR